MYMYIYIYIYTYIYIHITEANMIHTIAESLHGASPVRGALGVVQAVQLRGVQVLGDFEGQGDLRFVARSVALACYDLPIKVVKKWELTLVDVKEWGLTVPPLFDVGSSFGMWYYLEVS